MFSDKIQKPRKTKGVYTLQQLQKQMEDYARLIVQIGANVQQGQTVVLACDVDCAEFARLIAAAAYDCGAREVVTRFSDDTLIRMRYERADGAVFDEVARWLPEFYEEYAGKKAAFIRVLASDPELLLGVDADRIQRANISSSTALKSYHDRMMANDFVWTLAAIPGTAWAKKVFPNIPAEDAIAKLWEAILKTVHVNGKDDPVAIWHEKLASMASRAAILNEHNFSKLHFKNQLGTDFTVALADNHRWSACGEKARTGVQFSANIPTEEIFTVPNRRAADGVVCASIPLSLNGNLVENMKFTIENGKIIKAEASAGLEYLEKQLDMDEGARYLGEVALVPHKSPISEMGILFYNTLFDENASCHLAFGSAYPLYRDTEPLCKDELNARGTNDSLVHVDFMIGTPDLQITGITQDGSKVPVFTDGNFAF